MANWKIKVPQGTYSSDKTIPESIASMNNAKKNAYSQTRVSHLGPYIKLKSVRPTMGV